MIEGGWTNAIKPPVLSHEGHVYIGWSRGSDGKVGVDDTVLTTFVPADTHNAPGLGVGPDGHVLAFYCEHNGSAIWMRDLTTLASATTVVTGGLYTYPMPFVWDGKLRLLFRDADGVTFPGDRWRLGTLDGTWSSFILAVEAGKPLYMQPAVSADRVDFAVGGSAPVDADAHIRHFYLDGTGYHQTDGTGMGSPPFGHSDMSLVYGDSRSWLNDVAPGPLIAFSIMDGPWENQQLRVWEPGTLHDIGVGGGTMALAWPTVYAGRQILGEDGIWTWPGDHYLGPGIGPHYADRVYWLTGTFDPEDTTDYSLTVVAGPGPISVRGSQSAWPSMRP